jgi:lysozyme
MALPAEAVDLIKSFEGYLKRFDNTDRVQPYLCPAGVATIGWGCTRYPDGRRVQLSDPPIDRPTATRYLESELRQDEAAFDRLTTRKLHVLQRGALVSFVYNCGSGAYRGSTLRKKVNEGQWDDVPRELRKWRMGGGRILAGLARRREAEIALFEKGRQRFSQGPWWTPGLGDVPGAESPPAPSPTPPPAPPPSDAEKSAWRRVLEWFFK